MATLSERIASLSGTDVQRPHWVSYGDKPVTDRTIRVAGLIAERLEGLEIDGRLMDCVCPNSDGSITISDGDSSVWVTVMTVREGQPSDCKR